MTMIEEMKDIINGVLSADGIEEGQRKELTDKITASLIAGRFVNFDCIVLDPQKSVQLLATILNGFKAERPFAILETPTENTDENTIDPRD